MQAGIDCIIPEMTKSAHTPHYEKILAELVAMRKKAGLTQRQLAKKLNREYSFVWRIETGERRLDLVEFYWVCIRRSFFRNPKRDVLGSTYFHSLGLTTYISRLRLLSFFLPSWRKRLKQPFSRA